MTLVEFLLALAILAILLGMLLPALNSSQEKARKWTCVGNLKQIGLSLRLYSGDQDNKFPCDAATTTLGSFGLLTNNYQTSYATWTCPQDRGVKAGSSNKSFTAKNLSYAYGGFGLTDKVQPDTPLVCDRSSAGDPRGTMPWEGNKWTHKSEYGYVFYSDGHVAACQNMHPPMYRAKNP